MMFRLLKLIGLLSLSTSFFSVGIIAPALSQSQNTPTQETTHNSRTESKEYPTQIATDAAVTWELESCTRKINHIVSCKFSFNSSGEGPYRGDRGNGIYYISSNQNTKLVDSEGNEYYVSKATMKNKVIGTKSVFNLNMYTNVKYQVTFDFNGVPDLVPYGMLLEIGVGAPGRDSGDYGSSVKYENVPFINLDGSISEVPISARHNKKPNHQDSNENQNTNPIINIPKICLPLIGCH